MLHSRTVAASGSSGSLRLFKLGDVIPDLDGLRAEIDEMRDVLMGRMPPPINVGVGTLMEVASAYFARALEIQQELQEKENDNIVARGDHLYKFRTGELRSFLDIAKNAVEMGSRRITMMSLEADMKEGY